MRRILVLLVFLITLSTNAQAKFGIKAGVNNSTLSNTLLDSKNAGYIGALVDIPITPYYSMQPELYYSNQGGKSNSDEFDNLSLDYISISFVNKFYFSEGNKGFHFILGPGADFNIGNQFIISFTEENDADITPVDISIFGGIGYELGFGLTMEARYKQGLISTDFLGSRDLFEEDGSQLNRVFQVGLAYKFKTR